MLKIDHGRQIKYVHSLQTLHKIRLSHYPLFFFIPHQKHHLICIELYQIVNVQAILQPLRIQIDSNALCFAVQFHNLSLQKLKINRSGQG